MEVVELFERICSIPHCSGSTRELHDFIIEFCKKYGFEVETDEAGNILCRKGSPALVLQSHYDMVCVGKAPDVRLLQKDGWLMAENSSLGADNGIGVALMLWLISKGKEAEYLFTNDEEIGLIGAKNLGLELKAKRMLNLDSEEFGQIYVGCAGGADIEAKRPLRKTKIDRKYFYYIRAKNFPGGHSGVDIDKDIPNAIKSFAHFIDEARIASLIGGERRNSIPAHLEAIVATDSPLCGNDYFDVAPADAMEVSQEDLLTPLLAFAHGVRGWQKDFGIPSKSANLAKVRVDEEFHMECSLRANSDEELARLEKEYMAFFKGYGFEAKSLDRYPAWKPKITPFAKEVAALFESFVQKPSFKAIHAGLECAIFAKRYPRMQIVSIGPDIEHPHSTREQVNIESVRHLAKIVERIVG